MSDSELSHIDESGKATMVDVGDKAVTRRIARARGVVHLAEETLDAIQDRRIAKGEVMQVARIAGIMAAKRTSELIPLCHPLPLDDISIVFAPLSEPSAVAIEARARCDAKTGVEMEALTAVSIAALTIYDMCKAIDDTMHIGHIHLVEKTGGQSGDFEHPDAPGPTMSDADWR